jgi:citrate synthase
MNDLTTAEAAARLGVKRATLYAYVSRGLLRRRVALDGRTSLFDAAEIDAFRTRRRRIAEGELEAVVSTGLTHVADGELRVRGRSLTEMADSGMSYEDAVDWLWDDIGGVWVLPDEVAGAIGRAQLSLPATIPATERLRVTTAVVGALDPLRFDRSAGAVHKAGRVLLLAMCVGLPAPVTPVGPATPIASALWPRLSRISPSAEHLAALNSALVLLVDHGLAASTVAARVAASVRADPYSIVTAGLGVVGGGLHGAASGAVHRLLATVPDVSDVAAAVGETQRRTGGHVPGFGHKIYRTEDPRYPVLMRVVDAAWRGDPRLEIVHALCELVGSRTEAVPNVDLALGALTWLAEMPQDSGAAVFAIARTAGWIAHGLEEMAEPPLRFRPQARYVGPRW